MAKPAIIKMISNATVPTVSNTFINNKCDACALQITGTFTSATVSVEGIVDVNSGSWVSLATFDLTDLDIKTAGMSDKSIYQVGITGILRVRVNVTAVAGGNITVVANFVGTSWSGEELPPSSEVPFTAYDEAVLGGYTGTKSDFDAGLANVLNMGPLVQQAQNSANSAATSANAAATAASNAAGSAGSAVTSANAAAASASEAASAAATAAEDALNEITPEAVTGWLDENVDPVGSAVIVDSSLKISGAAADAKVTGNAVVDLKTQIISTDNAITTSKNLFDANNCGYTNKTYIKTRTVGSAIGFATSTGANTYKACVYLEANINYMLSFTNSGNNTTRHVVLADANGIVLAAQNYSDNNSPVSLKFTQSGYLYIDMNTSVPRSSIMIEKGTVATGYAAYDNGIYGISVNKANAKVPSYAEYLTLLDAVTTSKNLLDPNTVNYGIYIVGTTTGNTITYNTSSTSKVYKKCAFLRANTDYTLTFESPTTSGNDFKIALCDANEIKLAIYSYAITVRTIHLNFSSDCYLYLQTYEDAYNVMLNEGTIAETYTPFDGKTYGISVNRMLNHVPTRMEANIAFLPSMTVKTIAHRGDDIDAPQCTAPAYIMARKNGLRIAENDVFNSSDNEFVMYHDPTLYRLKNIVDINGYHMYMDESDNVYWYDSENTQLYTYENGDYVASSVDISTLTRTNGSNYSVTDFPYAVLKRMDFGRYKGAKFAGTQILSFEEWVILCKQLGMEIYIDHKTNLNSTMIQTLVGIVRKWGMLDKASWICNESQAGYVRSNDPKARIVVLANPTSSNVATWSSYVGTGRGIAFDGPASGLTQSAVQLGLENGFEVECYYVDFEADEADALAYIRSLIDMGITGLTTDKYSVEWAYEYMLEQY